MQGSKEAKRAAAVAAVLEYMAMRAGRQQADPRQAEAPRAPGPRLWALYGRQALMNQRIRMQARRRT